jgi:1-acyl-sn-glycerol-3-phosphate acyltransferase
MTSIPKLTSPPYADFESPRGQAGLFSRIFPTAAFYGRIAPIVLSASYRAKKGIYSDEDFYTSSLNAAKAFQKTGAGMTVKGTEHIAKVDGPCVFIGNHMSTAETFLLAALIYPFSPVTFVVKQSLVDYPIFKHVMLSRNPIVVGRVNPRDDLKAVLVGGRELLDSGISIVIFPQKTRTVQFDREGFNTIGLKLAKRAGVPVIPLALKTNAWSNGKTFKDFGPFKPKEHVHFEFGEALYIAGPDRPVHEAIIEFIESRLSEWGVPIGS